jgi:hypothetical protein
LPENFPNWAYLKFLWCLKRLNALPIFLQPTTTTPSTGSPLAQARHRNLLFIAKDQILLSLDLGFVHDAYT